MMRKLLAMLLALALLLSLAACGNKSEGGSDSEEETEEGKLSPSKKENGPSVSFKAPNNVTVKFIWEAGEEGKGKLTKVETTTATKEDLKNNMGFDAESDLTASTRVTYEVTTQKGEGDLFTAGGTPVSYSSKITGESAGAYLAFMKNMLTKDGGEMPIMFRALESGETLTDKAELEEVIGMADSFLEGKFRLEGENLSVLEYMERGTIGKGASYETVRSSTYFVENGAVSRELNTESGLNGLYSITHYREDMTREKVEQYDENDKLLMTEYFNEKGEEIVRTEQSEREEEESAEENDPSYSDTDNSASAVTPTDPDFREPEEDWEWNESVSSPEIDWNGDNGDLSPELDWNGDNALSHPEFDWDSSYGTDGSDGELSYSPDEK